MASAVRVTVLGAGSWGTTVAALMSANSPTLVWGRDEGIVKDINGNHQNARFFGSRQLPRDLRATSNIEQAIAGADVLVLGIPSHAYRSLLTSVASLVRPWIPIVSLAKGLEPGTALRPSQIVEECLPGHPVAVVAGPNIAREVLDGFAAAAVVATRDEGVAASLQPLFRTRSFRTYRHSDVIGCELGGVLKNVIAIASGMADGLGVGHNTRALVIARGLNEMTRLGVAMGAQERTFAGLTGLGDLITTCASPESRNRRVGEELARGKTPNQIGLEMNQVAEGVRTVRSVIELAETYGVDMPIAREVDAVVNEGRRPVKAYRGLLRIAPGHENDSVA